MFFIIFRNICPGKNFTLADIKVCNQQDLSLNEEYQLYVIIALWSLLVLSLVEGILEKFTNLPMPFKKFQEKNEEVDKPESSNENP